ncbi:hypothetical protein [Mesorhizobium sp. ESP-6-2]|uniref:hypothetical protein n=1 Tax=Mesorhizobium sp. ESP-6-2 TaxID=2876625 RepID=UPI001CCBD210|nr:hypothetical protein [Mesorhizobium sp. ESP-6-2]
MGAACIAIVASAGYYMVAEYSAHATALERDKALAEVKYCERSLEILKSYRAGTAPLNAAISETTADFIVEGCAKNDGAYASKALPYLSKEAAANVSLAN